LTRGSGEERKNLAWRTGCETWCQEGATGTLLELDIWQGGQRNGKKSFFNTPPTKTNARNNPQTIRKEGVSRKKCRTIKKVGKTKRKGKGGEVVSGRKCSGGKGKVDGKKKDATEAEL